ncbi:MAG: universal stress protein [Pseudomonadota bacterium]
MKTLLAASDLSRRSDAALRRAAALAAQHSAALHVAHAVDDDLPDAMIAAQSEAARAHLAAALDGAAAELHVLPGDPAGVLCALADEIEAELLVVGRHRDRGLRDFVASATLERIVRATLRPCLLATSEGEAPYARVLCGVDLSPASASALRAARRLAPEAAIHAFHAVHAPHPRGLPRGAANPFVKAAEADLARWIKTEDLPSGMTGPESFEGGVEGVMQELFARDRPDLVALGAHGRGTLSPTHLGSFARHLILEPPCDVLIVRR